MPRSEKYDEGYLFSIYILEDGSLTAVMKYDGAPNSWKTLSGYEERHDWKKRLARIKDQLSVDDEKRISHKRQQRIKKLERLEEYLDEHLLPGDHGRSARLRPDNFSTAVTQRLLVGKFLEVMRGGASDRKELVSFVQEKITLTMEATGDILNEFVQRGDIGEQLALEFIRLLSVRVARSLGFRPEGQDEGDIDARPGGLRTAPALTLPEGGGNGS